MRAADGDDSGDRWFETQFPAVTLFAGSDLADPPQIDDEVSMDANQKRETKKSAGRKMGGAQVKSG